MPIVLKFDTIPGESKISGFADWIEVQSFQFGVGRGIGSARGTSTREGTDASVSEITITKMLDGTSVKLMEEALQGKLDHKVEITFLRAGATPVKYYELILEGCGVSGYSMSSGGDRPNESISLNFDKIEFKYTPVGDDLTGSAAGNVWNLAESKLG